MIALGQLADKLAVIAHDIRRAESVNLTDRPGILEALAKADGQLLEIVALLESHAAQPAQAGDVIYVRSGSGLALAFVREVGAGTHEGELRVAKWSEHGHRFMSDRWATPLDFRGFPDDRTTRKILRALTGVTPGTTGATS